MSNVIPRILNMLIKAGHPNTPEHEATSCARSAAKLFFKYKDKLEIIERGSYTPPECKSSYDIPDIETATQEIQLFNMIISKKVGTCLSCNLSFNVGEIIAHVNRKGSTHYKCRRYWTSV